MSQPATRALVTGASSGIGAALSRRLAARGLEVWLAARRKDSLEAEVEKIRSLGGKAHALSLDISKDKETYQTLQALDRESGGIDLVVANAAVAGKRTDVDLTETPYEELSDILHTNLIGNVATLTAFIPGMLARKGGHLVGISSLAADTHNPRATAYGASKAGLTHFLEAADIELRPKGIAVTIVHPGFVRTPSLEGYEGLPFVVEVEKAVGLIDRAILRRARMLRFPLPMAALARFPSLLPRALAHPIIRRATRRK